MDENKEVTVVMYHYIRDLSNSRYPFINGLEIEHFKYQIEYFKENYNIITMEMLIEAFDDSKILPPKSILLTFDDAYIDHYINVFPILKSYNIQGSFFPPVKAVIEHTVLDVNKIHFIISAESNKSKIINSVYKLLDKYRVEYGLESNDYYYQKLAIATRYDTPDIKFIKMLLQVELERSIRKIIIDDLYKEYFGINENVFSRELYMNYDQIKLMQRCGMHIGSHSYDHYWLGSLSKEKQKIELEKSLDFLYSLNTKNENWTLCYPYGNYNNETLELLKELKCKLAFSTNVNIAKVDRELRYRIPRFDTNDFPKEKKSEL